MGNLWRVWLKVPEDLEDLDSLVRAFQGAFGYKWEDVMVESQKPFVYHKDRDAYFAVKGLKEVTSLTVRDITGTGVQFFRLMVGS